MLFILKTEYQGHDRTRPLLNPSRGGLLLETINGDRQDYSNIMPYADRGTRGLTLCAYCCRIHGEKESLQNDLLKHFKVQLHCFAFFQ